MDRYLVLRVVLCGAAAVLAAAKLVECRKRMQLLLFFFCDAFSDVPRKSIPFSTEALIGY
jgi:hypothetical protein